MRKVPLEDDESSTFASYLLARTIPEDSTKAGVLESSHIGNESGQQGTDNIVIMMAKKKRLGTRKWIPDFFIAIQNNLGERHSLWIEMKRRKDGKWKSPSKVSEEQERWIRILDSIPNVAAHFAYGFEEAKNILDRYLFPWKQS